MLAVQDAIERLLESAGVVIPSELVPLDDGLNRVLAEDLVAGIDVPPAANSAMDGYALRSADWPGAEQAMRVSQRIAAGSVPRPLEAGTAARIFTGAGVPEGADTVVMQENTEPCDETRVRILELPEPGANIRPRGQDIARGAVILKRGARLSAQELGQIAAIGRAEIPCFKRLSVALVSTGDELARPGQQAGPGQIYNSNRFTVSGLLEAWGFEMIDMGITRDDPDTVRKVLQEAAARTDVIITTGGVSVGEEDHVRKVVESLGSIDLWKIAIKPGKPFAFGRVGDTPFLGLPGNPVSVFVTLLIVARPFLMRCQGAMLPEPRPVPMPAAFDKPGDSREDYLRVRAGADGLELFATQSSGVLSSVCWADGLARQRPGLDICAGDLVDYFPLQAFG
jgi:molybdopterin molybdotransferase